MKKIILYTATLVLAVWQTEAPATSGIYTTVESGWANQADLPSKDKIHARSTKADNFPIARLGVGYIHDFSFNPKFGIGFEAGTGYYGKNTYHFADGSKVNIKTTTIDFLFVAIAHLNQFDVFGKIGGNRNTTTGIKISADSNDDESTIQPEVVVGMNYNFTPHIAATVSYMHTFGKQITDFSDNGWACPGLNAVLAGIRFTFW